MSSARSESHRNLPVFRQRTASCSCGCPRLTNSNVCSSSVQSTDTGIGVLPACRGRWRNPRRHCERSEAIHASALGKMDCFAPLAMTVEISRSSRARRASARHSTYRRSRARSRSEEHTSELQSRTLISYAVFCLKKKKKKHKPKSTEICQQRKKQ